MQDARDYIIHMQDSLRILNYLLGLSSAPLYDAIPTIILSSHIYIFIHAI